MVSLETYYISGIPIPLDDIGFINQPKIKDYISKGISIEEFIQPFLVRLDNTTGFDDNKNLMELKKYLLDFDLLFLKNGDEFLFKDKSGTLLDKLLVSLELLYNTKDVVLNYEEQCIIIKGKHRINRLNYTKLADIVLEMCQTKKPEKPNNKPKYKDKHRQQLWEKLERKRAEEAKKKALTLADIINIVVHIKDFYTYENVINMTYYQLLNTYQVMMNKMSYDEFLMFKSSGQFEIKQEVKHWTTTTKINRSTLKI